MKNKIIKLTKAEEDIMQILWDLETGTVQDILSKFENPKPARTTIATMLNILETKNIVTHISQNRSNVYSCLVSKDEYSQKQIKDILTDYFDGSFSSLASFFIKKNDLELNELDTLLKETQKELEKIKKTK